MSWINLSAVARSTIQTMDQIVFMSMSTGRRDRRLLEGLLSSLPLFHQVARSQLGVTKALRRA